MDKAVIIAGGVGLGLLLLVMGSVQKKQSSTTVVDSVMNATAARDLAAPNIIAAASEYNGRVQELNNQRHQMDLAQASAHDSQIFDFMSKISNQDITATKNVLNFAGSNVSNYRQTDVQKKQIASTEKISLRKIAADEQVAMGQLALQKKQMDNQFINGIIGGITGGLNPAQSLYGGASSSGLNTGSGIAGGSGSVGAGGSGLQSIIGIIQSLLGGSSGGGLSSTGGGVGGGSSGGGGSILSSIIPAVLALL